MVPGIALKTDPPAFLFSSEMGLFIPCAIAIFKSLEAGPKELIEGVRYGIDPH